MKGHGCLEHYRSFHFTRILLHFAKNLRIILAFFGDHCGAEEQTVGHVVLQCPIHRPPHELHGLTVLNDETTKWLLNTCPEI